MKAPRSTLSHVVTYTCGCTATRPGGQPALGGDVHCAVHDVTAHVVSAVPEYAISCQDCRYRRFYGNAPTTAHTYASKHALSRRHTVVVSRAGVVVHMVGVSNAQLTLDAAEPPPF